MPREPAVDHLVILVHGTWGRGLLPFFKRGTAAWCEKGSLLRTRVSEALSGNVGFYVFKWTGANSPRSRVKAAERLEGEISKIIADKPDLRLHVIAHSHGRQHRDVCPGQGRIARSGQ